MFINLKTDAEPLIDQFSENLQAKWGMMSPQHALEHLLLVLNIASDPNHVAVATPEDRIERTQLFLMSDRPMPRDFKAPMLPKEEVMPLKYANLDEAKAALKQGLQDFYAFFEENPDAIVPHPVFGFCDKEKWEMIQRKHFTHHFLQFGLVEE